MKQTAQFKLNQWEKADRIQMEDFNADNNKIENAIAAARTELSVQIQKLRDDLDEITYITKPTHEFNGGGELYPSGSRRRRVDSAWFATT